MSARKSHQVSAATYAIFEHPDTSVVSGEDKVSLALEKKSIKEWAYVIHADKALTVQLRVRSFTYSMARRHRGNVGDPASAYPGYQQAPAQTALKQSQMFDLPPQFYRNQSGRFRLCSI